MTLTAAAPALAGGAPSLHRAVEMTNHDPGRSVDAGDLKIALRRIGRDAGRRVSRSERLALRRWATRLKDVADTALAQVGDPYAWGGAGPNSFDCSGLTLYSYRAAGVSLPHRSRTQAAITRSVSLRDLRVGDLLFFGSPVHHVGLYVGRGRFVDAPGRGRSVRVLTDLHRRSNLVKVGRVL